MNNAIKLGCLAILIETSGCAHIDFGGEGMTYYTPKPYLFVSTTKQCVTTATVVSVPAKRKVMKFVPGYGSANLSVTLANGMIASVGQQTSAKVPETLTSIASLGTAAAAAALRPRAATGKQVVCTPTAKMYPLVSGVPDIDHPLSFPVSEKTVNLGHARK
jgi:hypothetical protein